MWTKGHELKYWNKTGLKKGNSIYSKYRESFHFDDYDFKGKKILDIGCGPFGGVFGDIKDLELTLMDIISTEYLEMDKSLYPIIYGDLSKILPSDDNVFDFIVCTNAIDHIPDMQHGFNELFRVLQSKGVVFVHVHSRTKKQLNKAHVHKVGIERFRSMAESSGFKIIWEKIDADWVNDELDRKAIYAVLEKE
jgi:ubiquinone/menaquinone biosynthesis C-methylase UbiE